VVVVGEAVALDDTVELAVADVVAVTDVVVLAANGL